MDADKKTLALIEEVKKRKAEVAKLSKKAQWKTNCSFSYLEGKAERINIHVESNVMRLVGIAAFLRERGKSYAEAAKVLEVDAPPFTWDGFSVEEWMEDLATRVGKLQLESKKKKLEVLETRLEKIVSPELRAQMELDAIAAELET